MPDPEIPPGDMQLGEVNPITHVPDDAAMRPAAKVGLLGDDDPGIGNTDHMTGTTGGQAGTSR